MSDGVLGEGGFRPTHVSNRLQSAPTSSLCPCCGDVEMKADVVARKNPDGEGSGWFCWFFVCPVCGFIDFDRVNGVCRK